MGSILVLDVVVLSIVAFWGSLTTVSADNTQDSDFGANTRHVAGDGDELLQSGSSNNYRFSSTYSEKKQLTTTQFRYYDDDPGTPSAYNYNGNYGPANKHQSPPPANFPFPRKPWFYRGPGRNGKIDPPYNRIIADSVSSSTAKNLKPTYNNPSSPQVVPTEQSKNFYKRSLYKHDASFPRYADGTPVPHSFYNRPKISRPYTSAIPVQHVHNVQQSIYHHEYNTNIQNTNSNQHVNTNQQQQDNTAPPPPPPVQPVTYAPSAPARPDTQTYSPSAVSYDDYFAPAAGPAPQNSYSPNSALVVPQSSPTPYVSSPSYLLPPQSPRSPNSYSLPAPPNINPPAPTYGTQSPIPHYDQPVEVAKFAPQFPFQSHQPTLAVSSYGHTDVPSILQDSVPGVHEAHASYPLQYTIPIVSKSPAPPSPIYASSGEYYTHNTYASPYPYKYAHIEYFKHLITPATKSYDVEFKSANGIQQQEHGYTKTIPGYSTQYGYTPTREANVKTGSVSWTSPEGIPFTMSYIADENGFRPVGAHIPGQGAYQPTNYDSYASTNYD